MGIAVEKTHPAYILEPAYILTFVFVGDALVTMAVHAHTHAHLTALFRDYPGKPVPKRSNQSRFY